MKEKEREEARRLRREEGLSLREISEKLLVARSSVSRWVRDIGLTDEQMNRLMLLNPAARGEYNGAQKNKEIWEKKRAQFREEGREMWSTYENRPLLTSLVMLYWGEGSKRRSMFGFCNTDPDMMRVAIKGLREIFAVSDSEISFSFSCYTEIHTFDEIVDYWKEVTGLPEANLKKCQVNPRKVTRKKNFSKCPYGVCTIRTHNVEISQKIYGVLDSILDDLLGEERMSKEVYNV